MRWWCYIIGIGIGIGQLRAQKLQIIKPRDFKNVELPSEKTYKKKNTAFRRFYFNTVTRYNYIYNCEAIYDRLIEKAKDAHKDDYTRLLSIFNYSLDYTATALRPEIDSILQKSTAGILMRDLRNKWADDLYLLMGKAYYLRKDFDSAAMIFQFVNFHYQQPEAKKKKGPVSKYAGLVTFQRGRMPTIFTKEGERTIFSSRAPARNEALIWLLRTYIELEEDYDAVTLIDGMQKDPLLPKRLQPLLSEAVAFYYYKKEDYLQAAQYMAGTLPLSRDRQEKARRAFLVAQLYNRVNRQDLATKFLRGAVKYTYDPILEIYARLNFILQETHPNVFIINDHIRNMLQLAHRERFKRYKDLVYYACSFMALKKNDLEEALQYINTSAKYSYQQNAPERNRVYAQLFELLWQKKEYYLAGKALDSIHLPDATLYEKEPLLAEMKQYMPTYVRAYEQKQLQDSLRRLATYPEEKRQAIIKTLVKAQEAKIGQKLYERQIQSFLVQSGGQRSGGEWYFTNPKSVAEGIQLFQQQWGNRKNVDRWRLSSKISYNFKATASKLTREEDSLRAITKNDLATQILKELPLTEEQKIENDAKVAAITYQLAETEYLHIKDYVMASEHFQDILFKFPQFPKREEVYRQLYFVLNEDPNERNKQARLRELEAKYAKEFPQGKYTSLFVRALNKKQKSNLETEVKKKERLYILAYQQYSWRHFPKALAYLQELETLDTERVYKYKIAYMRAVYNLARRHYEEARKELSYIVSGLTQEPRPEEHLLLERSEQLLQKVQQEAGNQ